jgi:hypothetical protein
MDNIVKPTSNIIKSIIKIDLLKEIEKEAKKSNDSVVLTKVFLEKPNE